LNLIIGVNLDQNRKGFVCGVPEALYLMIHISIYIYLIDVEKRKCTCSKHKCREWSDRCL